MAEIYVYREARSDGARDLAAALGGKRVREAPLLRAGDYLVCWGTPVAQKGRNILNAVPLQNKYQDVLKLKEKGVATIEVALRRPAANAPQAPRVAIVANGIRNLFNSAMEHATDFVENEAPDFNSPVFKRGIEEFKNALVGFNDALRNGVREVPAPVAAAPQVAGEWLGRRFNHVGGKDLLGLNRNPPQYFARKEDIVEEYRVHSFLGKSIRAGKKVVREDVPAAQRHPWIRSWDGGWKMAYEGVKATPEIRNLAHSAVRALDLDFGAVDIGKTRDGRFIVLEVNRAPGIEGGTIVKYKEAIERWMRGEQ